MTKFISSLNESEVLLFQERAMVGRVSKTLIDQKDGSFVGFEVLTGKKPQYVPPSEITGYGKGFVMIKSLSSLSSPEDVIKIKNALNDEDILKMKAFYEDGRYIGRVKDATVDLKLLALERIYVNPKITAKFFAESLIFSAKMIVKIENKKIFIKDDRVKSLEKKLAPAVSPILE